MIAMMMGLVVVILAGFSYSREIQIQSIEGSLNNNNNTLTMYRLFGVWEKMRRVGWDDTANLIAIKILLHEYGARAQLVQAKFFGFGKTTAVVSRESGHEKQLAFQTLTPNIYCSASIGRPRHLCSIPDLITLQRHFAAVLMFSENLQISSIN